MVSRRSYRIKIILFKIELREAAKMLSNKYTCRLLRPPLLRWYTYMAKILSIWRKTQNNQSITKGPSVERMLWIIPASRSHNADYFSQFSFIMRVH